MTIGEFFLRLASDSEFLARYNADAESVAREAGLSEAQRALLVSGDLRKLRVKITAEFEIEGEIVAYQTVHTVPITIHAAQPPTAQD
jgi:hypothetical protein